MTSSIIWTIWWADLWPLTTALTAINRNDRAQRCVKHVLMLITLYINFFRPAINCVYYDRERLSIWIDVRWGQRLAHVIHRRITVDAISKTVHARLNSLSWFSRAFLRITVSIQLDFSRAFFPLVRTWQNNHLGWLSWHYHFDPYRLLSNNRWHHLYKVTNWLYGRVCNFLIQAPYH